MGLFQLVGMGIDAESGLPREVYSKTVFETYDQAQKFMEDYYYLILNNPLDENHPIGIRVFELEEYKKANTIKSLDNLELPLLSEHNLKLIEDFENKQIEDDIIDDIYEILSVSD
jgi:Ser-tRNA(Ala) deacylase AlaX